MAEIIRFLMTAMHKKRRIAKNGKVVDHQAMERLQLPTDEEIGKAFDQGKEAMIALFHITIRQLAARIQRLEDRVSKNTTCSGGKSNTCRFSCPLAGTCSKLV